MYELLKKDGMAKRGGFTLYTEQSSAGIYECRNSRSD